MNNLIDDIKTDLSARGYNEEVIEAVVKAIVDGITLEGLLSG